MKVLIVEDNLQMQALLTTLVGRLSAETTTCGDGDEALAAYATYHPDWVLMDLQMARIGGLEATRQIRAAFPAARIVVVTQYDDAHYRAAAYAAGACGYVLKDNLVEVLQILRPETDGGG
ncbi:MAG: response regulator [Luteitalea sp.]|nr:response regulator [Luteitalea sp.]